MSTVVAALARRGYRLLVRLYPTAFRREYGEDLILLFDDLVADRGAAVATARTGVDLVVTIPRYHLEVAMTTTNAARTHTAILAALPVAGVAAVMIGLPWVGALLTVAGVVLLVANRGRIARSIRTPDSSRRAHRLRMAAVSAGLFALCLLGYAVVIQGEEASTWGLLGTSVPGMGALVAAVGFLVAGIATPRDAAGAPGQAPGIAGRAS